MERKVIFKMDNGGSFTLELPEEEFDYLMKNEVVKIEVVCDDTRKVLYEKEETMEKVIIGCCPCQVCNNCDKKETEALGSTVVFNEDQCEQCEVYSNWLAVYKYFKEGKK